jgi:hypothetical protein
MKVFFGPEDVQLVLGFSMRAMRDLEIVLPHRNWTVTVSNYKGSGLEFGVREERASRKWRSLWGYQNVACHSRGTRSRKPELESVAALLRNWGKFW